MPGFVFDPTPDPASARGTLTVRTAPVGVRGVLTVIVKAARARGVLTVRTLGTLNERAVGSLRVRTLDVTPPPVDPPTPPPGVDRSVLPPKAFLVSSTVSTVVPCLSYSYTGGDQNSTPTLTVELPGRIDFQGSVTVVATAVPRHGGESFAAVYGPCKAIKPTFTRRAGKWITRLDCEDRTAKTARSRMTELAEFVPWVEHLLPEQIAAKEYREALEDLALSDVPCRQRRRLRKGYRTLRINALLSQLLGAYPIPWALTAELPFGDARLYERAGEVIGSTDEVPLYEGPVAPSYDGTKGKLVDAALLEFLSPLGWEIRLVGGVAYIGPPAPLAPPGGVDAMLGPAAQALTLEEEQIISAPDDEDAPIFSTTPVDATGQGDLPYKITVRLMEYQYLYGAVPAVPGHNLDPNRTEVSHSGDDETGRTTRTVQYANGRVSKETTVVDCRVQLYPPQFALAGGLATEWMNGATVTVTEHEYGHPTFADAETRSVTVEHAYVANTGRFFDTMRSETITTWSADGYLNERVTRTDDLIAIEPFVPTGSTEAQFRAVYGRTEQVERWREEERGLWHHVITVTRTAQKPIYDVGVAEIVGSVGVPSHAAPVDEHTSSAPPQVRPRCPEDPAQGQVVTYRERKEVVFYTNGAGPAATIDLPFLDEVPPGLLEQRYARALPRRRLKYEANVPLPVIVGPQRQLSVSGGPASARSTVTIEEALS